MKGRDPLDAYAFMTSRDRADWRSRFGEDREVTRSDLVDLELVFHAESQAAFLLSDNGDRARAQWAPKRLIEPSGGIFTMPQWLARAKGWI